MYKRQAATLLEPDIRAAGLPVRFATDVYKRQRHHLLDMGLTPDAEITLQKVAPMGCLLYT